MAEKYSSTGIMWKTIIVAIILIAIIYPLTNRNFGSAADVAKGNDGADVRIQPVAQFELAKAAPASSGPKDAASIYNGICAACHAGGAAGAPKTGDKAAWGPRIAQGKETMYKNALAGKGAMPPKGGAGNLSDAEIKATVDYLVGLAK